MSDVIRWNDQYYILASSSLADARTEVLKHGETFAVFDRYGEIHQVVPGPQGLYHEGTRFLSRFELSLGTQRLMMLSASAKEDNALFTVDFTNSDIMLENQRYVPRGRFIFLAHDFSGKGRGTSVSAFITMERQDFPFRSRSDSKLILPTSLRREENAAAPQWASQNHSIQIRTRIWVQRAG